MNSEPRKKIDFLYQEILGEADALIKRMEKITIDLGKLEINHADAKRVLEDFPAELHNSLSKSSEVIAKNAAISIGDTLTEVETNLKVTSENSANYARLARITANKIIGFAVLLSLTSGLAGGMLVGLILL